MKKNTYAVGTFSVFSHRFFSLMVVTSKFTKLKNFDHSCPNKLKFGLGSLWGSLKKIIYQIFDILIFRNFLGSEKCRIGKNR